jgi:hypothetical protein
VCRIIRGSDADGAISERVHISTTSAQRIHQVARRQGHADRVCGEGAPVWRNDLGARLHGAARQRRISRDHDSAGAGAGTRRDLIVRLIHAGADDHALDQRIARHRDGGVGDDEDFEGGALERMALGDAINLLLYWAGVGVDVKVDGLWFHSITAMRDPAARPSPSACDFAI